MRHINTLCGVLYLKMDSSVGIIVDRVEETIKTDNDSGQDQWTY